MRLIRFPNLVFIALTQILFFYAIGKPALGSAASSETLFFILVAASLFIAAGGYIINDYFDVQIDAVNRPNRVVVNRSIKRRWAIVLHFVFSCIGITLSIYISFTTGSLIFALGNFGCVVVLWLYSAVFKRKLLIGNLLIAALTAWTLLVVYLLIVHGSLPFVPMDAGGRLLLRCTIFYAGFAFVTTLIREAVKDMEDVEGDRRYGCRTMPIVWGIPVTKVYTAVWICICIAGVAAAGVYLFAAGYWSVVLYACIALALPLLLMLRSLYRGQVCADFTRLSRMTKLIMLAGILSMSFFFFK